MIPDIASSKKLYNCTHMDHDIGHHIEKELKRLENELEALKKIVEMSERVM